MRYIYTFLLLSYTLSGCSGFLEESSQDEVRPSTINDLEQLMLGEAYPMSNYFINYLDLMTDDVECNYWDDQGHASALEKGAPAFTWSKEMYEEMEQASTYGTDTWERYYAKIMGCNVVLSMLDKVKGSDADKLNVRGQALSLRAYYHFMLVNLYGPAYNDKNIDVKKALGVPLKLNPDVTDEFPSRNTVYEVYEQIEKDLKEALPMLEQYGSNNIAYKVTDLFAHTLLARMYLYMERWDEALLHAEYVVKRKPVLVKLADHFTTDENGFELPNRYYSVFQSNSTELIWGFSSVNEFSSFYITPAMPGPATYQASENLLNLYDYNASDKDKRGDLRIDYFYQHYVTGMEFVWFPVFQLVMTSRIHYGHKTTTDGRGVNKGMRSSELYLIRAECNIRKYIESGDQQLAEKALKDLNYIRERRYDTRNEQYVPVNITEPEALLEFCKDERRRELSFEEHRWFDLKRYGMPEIKHTLYVDEKTSTEFVLPQGSKRYVLPIAKKVLDRNPGLVQND